MEIRGSSMAWRVRRAAPRRWTWDHDWRKSCLAIFSHPVSLALSLSVSFSSLFATARFYNSTHRYLRQGVDSPLVVDLPTRGDASLAHRSRPACSKARLSLGSSGYIFSLCVCVRGLEAVLAAPLGRGEHPPSLIGPAPGASLLILAFARLPRSSSLAAYTAGAVLSKMVDSDALDVTRT